MLRNLQNYLSQRTDQNILAIILVGSISWILTMFRSGSITEYGMSFWGANGHDGVWHISLANSLSQGRLELPIFAGANIKNYHIGFDLILAILHKITFISLNDLYFRYLPILFSLSIGFLLYKLLSLLKWNQSHIFWALFFVYFGGNLSLGGESTYWSSQAISTLINPPFALSLIFILSGLIFLQNYLKIHSTRYMLLATISFGLLIQIKAYSSVVVLGSLFLSGFYQFFKDKNSSVLKIWFLSSLVSAIIFLPFNSGSTSLFEFKPFWFLETMMSFSDRVGWTRFGEAMVNYKLAGNFVKGIAAYKIAFLIFVLGNLGTRFISIFYIAKFKKFSNFDVLSLSAILIGIIIPTLFVQKGTAWNTIQFFYYSLFFASILAGFIFSEIINSKVNLKYKNIFVIGIVLFTCHTTYKTLKDVYITSRPPAKISIQELEALKFLESQPSGIVLTLPFDKREAEDAISNPPRPLYAYESTAYVSAFSGKQVFMEDEVNLDITGFDWQQKKEQINQYLSNPNTEFLTKNNIKYVYLAGNRAQTYHKLGLEMIYDSESVKILKHD